MASNPFEGFTFSQKTASPVAVSKAPAKSPSPSHSLKAPRARHPAADSSPDSAPQKKRKGTSEHRAASQGSGDDGLAQCLAREQELKQRLGPGLGEKLGGGSFPMRLIIVGHNPSEATWAASHVYAHKSNHMWRLLIQTGIAPPGTRGPEADDTMPHSVGVGFTDVGTGHPGTKSSDFSTQVFLHWRTDFYERMRAHMRAASESIGCSCGTCGAPALVAFSGKRHYMELLNAGRRGKSKIAKVDIGIQPANLIPPGWPFPASSQVIVCCSTSGASPMTAAERLAPYQVLASQLADVPWPRAGLPRCKEKGSAG